MIAGTTALCIISIHAGIALNKFDRARDLAIIALGLAAIGISVCNRIINDKRMLRIENRIEFHKHGR